LSFEANEGQTDPAVRFLSRGPGYALFLTSSEAVLALRQGKSAPKALRMKIEGAHVAPTVAGVEALPGKSNYFIGNDRGKWRKGIHTFAKVEYRNVYPGVNLVYYGKQRQLEYDFVLSPGADPNAIRLAFEGAETLAIDGGGDLVLKLGGGEVRMRKPAIYQERAGKREPVAGRYILRETNRVGVEVMAYDATRPLVIDPVLVYSTYLGGSGVQDVGFAIAVDGSGSAYVTGETTSLDFPTTGLGFDTSFNGFTDAFVTKLDASGSNLVYSTYLGGSTDGDSGQAIAVDSTGHAYVAGHTSSSNFPTTALAFDTSFNGGGFDAFVTKLDPTGSSLVYSTYLGGNAFDAALAVAVDAAGQAYVGGHTASTNFPATAGAFATSSAGSHDAFVTSVNAAGSGLIYSTYVGGSDADIGIGLALDATGAAYLAGYTRSADFATTPAAFDSSFNGPFNGSDAFVAKLNPGGSALAYATFLGGSDADFGWDVAVDSAGNAYVTGATLSTDFPTTPGAYDTTYNGSSPPAEAFVTKLDAAGSALVYSTFLGGTGDEFGIAIAVDAAGQAHVAGHTTSTDFPTTAGAIQPGPGGSFDAFVTKLDAAGAALVDSTYFGGSSQEQAIGIAVSSAGDAYVVGWTDSGDFPTTPGAFDTTFNGGQDAFVAKISGAAAPIGPPTDKNQCKDGGWRVFNNPPFRNQGQCVSYVQRRR
jgi:hypothetical protein